MDAAMAEVGISPPNYMPNKYKTLIPDALWLPKLLIRVLRIPLGISVSRRTMYTGGESSLLLSRSNDYNACLEGIAEIFSAAILRGTALLMVGWVMKFK